MPLSWDLIIRFTLGGGQRRFTRFVALASLLGMLLGVAAPAHVLHGSATVRSVLNMTAVAVVEAQTRGEPARISEAVSATAD